MTSTALPPVVDAATWQEQLDALRVREKAATRELDAVAAQRRRLPMSSCPTTCSTARTARSGSSKSSTARRSSSPTTTCGSPARSGSAAAAPASRRSSPGWSSSAATTRASSSSQGPIDEALAYRDRVGNRMNVVLDGAQPVRRRRRCAARRRLRRQRVPPRRRHGLPDLAHGRRGTEQHPHLRADRPAALRPPRGVQDSPQGWPREPAYSRWTAARTSRAPTARRADARRSTAPPAAGRRRPATAAAARCRSATS